MSDVAEQPGADERRLRWDERHRAGDFEGRGANPTLVAAVRGLGRGTGRALEIASGSGTNAVFLAGEGWRVTAVDWSPVGIGHGREKAGTAGVEVEWLERNLFQWRPPERAFDLVVIVYLHLPSGEREPVYSAAAAAVAPGGRLMVIGHDRANATEPGVEGPSPDRLFSADEVGRALLAADPELVVERAEALRRDPPGRAPIDALLVVRRAAEAGATEAGAGSGSGESKEPQA